MSEYIFIPTPKSTWRTLEWKLINQLALHPKLSAESEFEVIAGLEGAPDVALKVYPKEIVFFYQSSQLHFYTYEDARTDCVQALIRFLEMVKKGLVEIEVIKKGDFIYKQKVFLRAGSKRVLYMLSMGTKIPLKHLLKRKSKQVVSLNL